MYKKIYFKKNKLFKGIEKLYNCVKVTLGPKGNNVIIEKEFGNPTITKDGVTVAKEIFFKNKIENLGSLMVREVASKTNEDAGDGTTTAIIITRTIIKESRKHILLGTSPLIIKKQIEKFLKIILRRINKISKKIKKNFEILQVASISSNNDYKIGSLISTALSKVGKNGIITLEDGKFNKDKLNIVKGYSFEKGYFSHYFLKSNEKKIIFLNSLILIHYKKISNFRIIFPVLEKISKIGGSLLIISDGIESEILNTLIVNNIRGIINVVYVKAPYFGENKLMFMEDIATITGGKIIKDNQKIKIKNLGKAKKIEITKKMTTIIKGKGKNSIIKKRIKKLKNDLFKSKSKFFNKNINKRISKLSGGVAIIEVGGTTKSEVKEKKYRIEDAVNATKAAIEQGIVPGGGITYLRVCEWLKKKIKKKKQNNGFRILIKSLQSPFKRIMKNGGKNPDIIFNKVSNKKLNFGYDLENKCYCDLIKCGIIDPAKVIKFAFKNAVSISLLIITAGCIIINKKKKDINIS
ncbi:chaperonin GroEL [Candidatus Vidania fulgoroideorum]